ncbi:MAG: flagellar biosynthetic protein FliO, partial [Oscillospiraceae bacterium]
MDFMKDVLPLLGSLAAIAAVLYLTYLFSKFMGTRVNEMGNKGNIKIVERVALGQDKGLAVAEINQKYYLLGISNNNISMLMEM